MNNFFKSRTIQGAIIGFIGLVLITALTYWSQYSKFTTTNEFYYTDNLKENLPNYTSKLSEADCWINSISSNRPDAFRCVVNDRIFDPCFINPFYDSLLVCPTNPYKDRLYFKVNPDKLPRSETEKLGKNIDNYPWNIKLVDDTECSFETGATALIAGMRIDYSCNNKKYDGLLLPIIKEDRLLKIKCYIGSKIENCDIKEVWY
jgi:hypothetical protein